MHVPEPHHPTRVACAEAEASYCDCCSGCCQGHTRVSALCAMQALVTKGSLVVLKKAVARRLWMCCGRRVSSTFGRTLYECTAQTYAPNGRGYSPWRIASEVHPTIFDVLLGRNRLRAQENGAQAWRTNHESGACLESRGLKHLYCGMNI